MQLVDSNCVNENSQNTEDYDHRKINFCVAQPTTPANYFHLLRRQMVRSYRKPLVVFTPKIGLRSPYYVTEISEFGEDKKFNSILINEFGNNFSSQNLIFCSGQIFIEIKKAADNYFQKHKKQANLTLIRIEELALFP